MTEQKNIVPFWVQEFAKLKKQIIEEQQNKQTGATNNATQQADR